ncbi:MULTISPECIES: rod shape-determining protein MreC [Dehalobacter]|uniref:Cell shape-determining protein MreC n=2 Tax=Dehalobacter restrictus TaxID=55583 RepID=A0A857DLK4_9FIRM|nr:MULTISPECIES: rod shape-determining protein MreC [Dehalobacter]AHF10828.1 rod shape-determining protein MreC [Dehalobacter restrictus DSM 9455]MCG1024915.1 rod shape-determining protein MreC [Dehalobacter sp.]OCZ52153.1 rod shape-determining protein MreC [Dehalobacter sp. TeCB1]QHA01478.1 rod shape-determining protein MreC [Dehalobacter restrictus]
MGKKINPMGIAVLVFAVLLITLTTIHLTGLGSQSPNPVGNAMQRVLSPIESAIWNLGDGIKDNFRAIFSFRTVKAENEELRKQVETLTGDNLQLKQQVLAALRYQELDAVFQSPSLESYEKIGATIINRNPSAWYQTVTVNKGSDHGVKVDDPVVANLGLVGKVISVTPKTSDVLLLLDGEGQVGAFARGNKGEAIFGIVKGTYKKNTRLNSSGELEMNFRQDDEVNAGDLVYTSGLGEVYPKDIPIGVVTEIKIDAKGLLKVAAIEPIVDFDSLEEVYVVSIPEDSR